MATITITIPDEYTATLLDAFDGLYSGRTRAEVDPELGETVIVELYTKPEWARLQLRAWLRRIYERWMVQVAAELATEQAETQAEQESDGITVT
jgi:hypothetical protein